MVSLHFSVEIIDVMLKYFFNATLLAHRNAGKIHLIIFSLCFCLITIMEMAISNKFLKSDGTADLRSVRVGSGSVRSQPESVNRRLTDCL